MEIVLLFDLYLDGRVNNHIRAERSCWFCGAVEASAPPITENILFT